MRSSTIRVGISKKAFRNDPPTTLPQFLHKNLWKGAKHPVFSGLFQYQSTAAPPTQKLTRIRKYYTCVSQELECPNKFKNVQDFPESSVVEIEKVSITSRLGRKAAVLPNDKSN